MEARVVSAATTYWLERAWTGDRMVDGVAVSVEDGRFVRVEQALPGDAERLAGLTVPGFANCHSHAFHRALRGRTQAGRGSFWTWREQMYAVAGRLTPDSYYALARATYREMVSAGYTGVGEFHYLHHQGDGTAYDDPNQMAKALLAAAHDAGIRITLLDTCYLAAGFGRPPEGVQVRYSDGDAEAWAKRVEGLASGDGRLVGAAVHSVRAVPREQIPTVVEWADVRRAPLHVHLSEQTAENDACIAAHGATPSELLADAGAWGPRASAVHATHLTEGDIALLGASGTHACLCPTTERDLGDGIGPSRELHTAGSPLTLGSDSQAVVDPFEEMRAVELDERLATRERGHWAAEELIAAGTVQGHRSLGFPDAGRIEVGARADLVVLDTATATMAGTGGDVASVVFAATAADVRRVMVDGRWVVGVEDRAQVGAELRAAIERIWEG
ncbi:MAG TPA: formimidoylglutamate deiminase [Nocardioidaceae bacterium]|nr:formimidoylglutamate deiminase [Nocardioidaceae bacterium]